MRLSTHVLLLERALSAVIGVRDADCAANDALALKRAVVTLIAYMHENVRPNVRVANNALAVAPLAQPP